MENGNKGRVSTKTTLTEKTVQWELEARGRVQRVGYRDFVQETASLLKVTGKVWNDQKDEQLIHLIVQGPESTLPEFVKAITGKHGLIDAAEVRKIGEKEADPSLTGYHQVRGEPLVELAEATAQGARALNMLIGLGIETLSVGKETLSVSKETLTAVQTGNATLGKKVDGVADVVREDIRSNAEFRHELADAVGLLDTQYGLISKTLVKIDHDLQAQTKAINTQTHALVQLAKAVTRGGGRPIPSSKARKAKHRKK